MAFAGESVDSGHGRPAASKPAALGATSATDRRGRLFPELVRSLDDGHRIRVLEIGAARSETVEFFSRYRCQLFFADLYSAAFLIDQQKSLSPSLLQARFRVALDLPREARFDLCLFWNIFQFLTGPAVRALCAELEQHVHKGTRAHALGVHSAVTACQRAQYAIRDASTFKPVTQGFPELPYHPHPQAELAELLDIFKIERAMLHGDGTVEMLLGAKPFWD